MTVEVKQEYQWHPSFRSKITNIPVSRVIKELDSIQKDFGEITPDLLVEKAIAKKSVLHDYFEWDDKKAAHTFRLRQAADLLRNIEVRIISDDHPKTVRVYETVLRSAGSHKKFDSLDNNDVLAIKKMALSDLSRIYKKLSGFPELEQYAVSLKVVIDNLSKVSTETLVDSNGLAEVEIRGDERREMVPQGAYRAGRAVV